MTAKAPFELQHERQGDALVVRARGKFDGSAGEAVDKLVRAERSARVVLNMDRVEYISSSGVAALVKLNSARPLRIASPAQCVKDVLSLAGIERVLSIHATEEAARRAD